MPNFKELFSNEYKNEYESAYDLSVERNFSEPKIFTGGVDISKWSTLTKSERSKALS
ncbi:hypothetical protein ACOCEA_06925 [Maribacter sp. CXY002]|uniref:hypothetical protein n=1 Tax=Maribacter luteocoastalis TaxID=3407671 RepID=UPI003B66D035